MALPVMPSNRLAKVKSDTFMVSSFIFRGMKNAFPGLGKAAKATVPLPFGTPLREVPLQGKANFPKRCIRRTGSAYTAVCFRP
jgi:hypothetical protein